MKLKLNIKTVPQYAAEKGCKPTYIYRLIREGKLKTVDIAGKKFIQA